MSDGKQQGIKPTYVNVTVRIKNKQGQRFKHMSKADRYSYNQWLVILMDHFDKASNNGTSLKPSTATTDTSLFIRIEEEQGERFKRMSKVNRYPYGQFLTILMDRFEGK